MLVHRSSFAALAIFLTPAFALADVRVVASNGTGQFTTIQAALNAASDGDVILVKPTGSYTGFSAPDLSLSIVADVGGDGIVLRTGIQVPALATTRTLVISGFRVTDPAQPALDASSISGNLRVEHCRFVGADGEMDLANNVSTPGLSAARITSSLGGSAFIGCTFQGGAGGAIAGAPIVACIDGADGGDGLVLQGARAALYECNVTGGAGGDSWSAFGGDGGDGLALRTGAFKSVSLVSHSTLTGARGGSAGDPQCPAIQSGDGGDGASLQLSTSALYLANDFAGGAPGAVLGGGSGALGGVGANLANNGGRWTMFNATPVGMTLPTVVRAGSQMTMQVSGTPGDQLYLFEAPRTTFLGFASWRGFWLAKPLGPQMSVNPPLPIAVVPQRGIATVTLPAPELGANEQGRTHHYQIYRVGAGGSLTLGSYAAVTVVQPGF